MNPIFPITRKDLFNLVMTFMLLGLAFVFFFATPTSMAKSFDREYGFWVQIVILAAFIIGVLINFKSLLTYFKKHQPAKKFWAAILLITLFVGVFGSQEVGLQHRVLSDESSWESMGIQMFYNQRAGICNQGIFENQDLNCYEEVNNFKGKTTGIFYWVLFHFLEPNRDSALLLNFPLFLLSIILLFYGTWLIFNRPWVALGAGLFLGTLPKMLFQSRTATTEVAYVFLFCLTLVLITLLKKEGYKWKHLFLILPVLGLLAGTRQETLFSFMPIVFIYAPLWRKSSWGLPALVSGLMLVCFPIVVTIAAYKGFNFQGGEYEAHSFYNLYRNFWDNILVLLNLKEGYQGLLHYPFSTTQTIIIYLSAIYLTLQALWTGKYLGHLLLFLLFFLQPLVVMINVSGNFTIDINQRYVLIILPIFAMVASLGFEEILIRIQGAFQSRWKPMVPAISFSILFAICIGLTLNHKDSYNANIHYKKNKLLEEEKFLNSYLKTLPENSIFIYARPWQMISQHLNAFSETRFLSWNNDELKLWQEKSNHNIYLVRGQDGYGKVNRKSRVVGFKTTDKVERILKQFHIEEIKRQTRPFGYALTVSRIGDKKSANPFEMKSQLKLPNKVLTSHILELDFSKSFEGSAQIQLSHQERVILDTTILDDQAKLQIPLENQLGIQRLSQRIIYPDSSFSEKSWSIYLKSPNTQLLPNLKTSKKVSGWGNSHFNYSVEKNSLKVKGEIFPWGIGTHANSQTHFRLNNKFSKFHTLMGMDDESMCGDGAIFEIYGDGKLLHRTQAIFAEELQEITVDVKGVQELQLHTLQGETDLCDHSNWLNPWVER